MQKDQDIKQGYRRVSEVHAIVYNEFIEQYQITKSPFDLAVAHFALEYLAIVENYYDIWALLPPKPEEPTAMQLAYKHSVVSSFLLPFVIFELADPKSGRLPQCDLPVREQSNTFEQVVSAVRSCFLDEKPEMCEKSTVVYIASRQESELEAIANSAQEYLRIEVAGATVETDNPEL